MSSRPPRSTRADYKRFTPVATRWEDNDVYGHVNNAVYYSFFDTAVNRLLIEAGILDAQSSEIVGLVVSNRCDYFSSVAFPDALEAGVAVAHIGRSSIHYRLGIFRAGDDAAAAQGEFVHVYVARATQTPVELPAAMRAYFETLL